MAAPSFFQDNPCEELAIANLSGELNTYDADIDINDNQLSGGQNMTRAGATDSSIKKRGGIQLYGQFLGATTGILGGYNSLGSDGTQDQLCAYDTKLYRYTAGVWTALTGVTLTTNKPGDFVYFHATNKTYYINGTDNVVKYTPGGAAGDQTDSAFKKGLYIENWHERLIVAGVAGQLNTVWYSDGDGDTFSVSNSFIVNGAVTGLRVFQDKLYIFTKTKIFRVYNFDFNGVASQPSQIDPIPTSFGAIYERTIQVVNNQCYFLGQDTTYSAAVYVLDMMGFQATPLSDMKISSTMKSVNTSQLANACAGRDGFSYRLYIATGASTVNDTGIIFDTNRQYFYPIQNRFIANRAPFSVLWSSEVSGQWYVFGGTAGTGQVYQLSANDGLYDELGEERYLTSGSYSVAINQNPARRLSQSFKMTQYQNTDTVEITQIALQLKYIAGTAANLVVRLETDNNGKPSGTLAGPAAQATLTAFTGATYAWYNAVFTTAVALLGNTSYWIVCQHQTEGSGNSQYTGLADSCTATYTSGNLATYTSGVTANTSTFNPNAATDSAKTSVDGNVNYYVNSGGLTWANISGGSGGQGSASDSNSVLDIFLLGSTTANQWQELNRTMALFDTSALPDDAVITSAKLSLYFTATQNDFSSAVGITGATPAANTALVAADYVQVGSTRYATDIAVNALALNAYTDFALNGTGIAAISKTGVSKFAVRLNHDIDNAPPTWISRGATDVQYQSAEDTNKPRLVITYTSVSGSASWTPDPTSDLTFVVYAQSPIDGFIDTKAFLPANGRLMQLERFETIFNTTANYSVEISFSSASFVGSSIYPVSLAGPSSSWTWDDGVTQWDAATTAYWDVVTAGGREYSWTEVNDYVDRTIKLRVRNRYANQQFEFNRCILEISPRLTHT